VLTYYRLSILFIDPSTKGFRFVVLRGIVSRRKPREIFLHARARLLVFLSVDEETIIQRKDEYGPEKRRFLLDRADHGRRGFRGARYHFRRD